jgi:DNA-binding NtrC family response regulator
MPIRVLLVDDEEQFVETLAERLQMREFDVWTAHTGEEALVRLKEEETDVVVLDVLMPGKDGIETLREIKKLSPMTEVMMLTGHATMDSAIQGLKFGAYDYLMKPTETEDLVAKILKAYARKLEQEERIRRAESDKASQNKS